MANEKEMTGLFNTRKSCTIMMHAAGCQMLNRSNDRNVHRVTLEQALDAKKGQGFKVVYCKCTK